MVSKAISRTLTLTVLIIGCSRTGAGDRKTLKAGWLGEHEYRKVFVSAFTDHVLATAKFRVTETTDRRFQVTDLKSQCSMVLDMQGRALEGRDVECVFLPESPVRPEKRVYRSIRFDFDKGTVLGLFENQNTGHAPELLIEDDFDITRSDQDRLRFTGNLSNTAQVGGGTEEACKTQADTRIGEVDIIVDRANSVFFPGFRCRVEVVRDAHNGFDAKNVICVPDPTPPTLADTRIVKRQFASLSYDATARKLSYSAQTEGWMEHAGPSGPGVGTWCSSFSGTVTAN